MRKKILTAEDIKAILIDEILKKRKKSKIIISELPFSSFSKQLADLVYNYNSETIAFEIKGERDNLYKISEQINGYLNTFNQVVLVLHKKFANSKLLKKLPKKVGIYMLAANEKIDIVRNPGSSKRLSKKALSSLLWKQDLQQLFGNEKLHILKQKLYKMSNYNIQKIVQDKLCERYLDRFEIFMKERGVKTKTEEVKYLRVQYTSLFPCLEK
jgi:hypothetical protein